MAVKHDKCHNPDYSDGVIPINRQMKVACRK